MANILDGIKVVEVASVVAGPAAATQLSDFGAEVIKIEPLEGDMWRMANHMPPFPESKIPYTHLLTNRNKQSVALNLKSPEVQQILYKLVEKADVFITNSLPHVLQHLNIGYEKIRTINPRIVYALITGWGEKGPDADSPGFDCTAWWARSGLMDALRGPGAEPVNLPPAMGDHNTATALFAAVMTGLYQRERTGKGCKVSTSLLANGAWTNGVNAQIALVGLKVPENVAHVDTPNPLIGGIFKTKDDRYILIEQANPKNWAAMCDAFGVSKAAGDPRYATPEARIKNHQDLMRAMDRVLGKLDMAEAVANLRAAKTNFSVVATVEELTKDPQAIENGLFPRIEGTDLRTVQSPISVEGIAKVAPRKAPEKIGQDTRAVLKAAGLTDEQIEKLAAAKVIGVV